MRNMMATLLFSQGVPMILHGDEIARTQEGNNNVYCQDNEASWMQWELTEEQEAMLDWTRRVVKVRNDHAVLRRRHFFAGRPIRGADVKDILWVKHTGEEMSDHDWANSEVRSIGLLLAGEATDMHDDQYRPIMDDTLLILMNSQPEPVEFHLAASLGVTEWKLVLDTGEPQKADGEWSYTPETSYRLDARALAVLRHPSTA